MAITDSNGAVKEKGHPLVKLWSSFDTYENIVKLQDENGNVLALLHY